MAEARIDVVIGSAQAQAGAKAVARAVDDIKSSFMDMAAKVVVVEQAIIRTWRAAAHGAAFEETMGRLNRQMGAFHGTAQSMVSDLQAISNQTLSVDRTATLASRALAAGFDPSQIRTFTQAADQLDDVLGTDLPTAFDQIVQAAITGRSQILANIGVYIDLDDQIKRLAVSTGRTTEQITKQERAMIMAKAITDQTGDAMKKLTDGVMSDADRLKQIEAKWDNFWLKVGQGAKSAFVLAMEWGEKFAQWMEEQAKKQEANEKAAQSGEGPVIAPFGRRGFRNEGHPHSNDPKAHAEHLDIERRTREAEQREHDAVVAATRDAANQELFQTILGRAIVSDAQGRLPQPPKLPVALPPTLQGKQLESERERQDKALQGDFERTRTRLAAISQLYDQDAQQQILSQEEVVQFKGTLRLQELAKHGEMLSRQLEMEKTFHDRRVAIGFESTEDKIGEDERYRSKVFEINQAIQTNVQTFGQVTDQNEAERRAARMQAEQQLGQRLTESAKSRYDIDEAARQRNFDAIQVYYQGEIDMANARFASDEEIAQKERTMLREQLAFKLRITREELDRIMLLRQTGNIDQANRRLAEHADPNLPLAAREGMLESGYARDIQAMERANGDFFAGWTRGLQKYAQDRDSAFGMSADMARRAAQGMEQGFQRFFFDGMEAKFTGFKDVLAGVLDFTKQIVSQVAAQMMTIGLIRPGASALVGLFGGGPTITPTANQYPYPIGPLPQRFGGVVPIERYAMGGVTSRPRMMAMGGTLVEYGEGPQAEAFVPLPDGRTIPVTMRFAGAMPTAMPAVMPRASEPGPPQVIINNYGSPKEATAEVRRTGPDQREVVYVTIRDAVTRAIGNGDLDRSLESNFGLNRSGAKR